MTVALHGVETVRARIARAAARAGRDPSSVTLVAVGKGFAWSRIEPVVRSAGLTDLGENRAQELRAKQAEAGDTSVRWHMIGALQRNKVKDVVGRVVLIHSVDSTRLADAIAARARTAGLTQDVLLEVNTSAEPHKHGVNPHRADELADEVARMEGVRLRGLMTIAAAGDPDRARRCFALLRELRDGLVARHPGARELSMGMSDDLEHAIAEGSTMVRVGTAIFGPRPAHDHARAHDHGTAHDHATDMDRSHGEGDRGLRGEP